MNEGILKKLESNLKTNFIYNSNAIEGNTLTLKETDIILPLVLNDDIENRGKFKQSNNEILGAGFKTTPYYLVEEKLTELIDKYNCN